jgi:hypothetical protein
MARPKGSTKYKFNQDQADRIEKLAAIGLNKEHIMAVEQMGESVMYKLYGDYIKRGKARGIAAVATTLYNKAVKGDCPAMTIFFLKVRGGWKDVQAIEHSGPGGKPIETTSDNTIYETTWRELPKPKEES